MALYFSKNGGSTAIEGEEVGEIAYLLNPDQTNVHGVSNSCSKELLPFV